MTTMQQDDDLLRRYLLGELLPEEAEAVEERLLQEDELFELAEAVEGDLLAACVRGELGPAERERIERRLASTPRGRTQLALAGDLTTVSRESAPLVKKSNVLPFPERLQRNVRRFAVAAGLVGALGLGWLMQSHRPDGLANHLGRGAVVTQELDSADLRLRGPGETAKSIELPRGTDFLDLKFHLDSESYSEFNVVITRASQEVHTARIDRKRGETTVRVPAERIPAGDYEVTAIPTGDPDDEIHWDLRVHGD